MGIGTTSIIQNTFAGLENDTLRELRQVATRKKYPVNTTLCKQGAVEHTFYIVAEGNVAVTQVAENGEERILGMIGPNGYFGEMGLIDDSPRMANCVTVMPTTVLEVDEGAFDQFVQQSPAIAYAMVQRVLSNARKVDQRNIEDLRQKNAQLEKAYSDLKAAQAMLLEKERVERELELAAEVQRNLLPGKLPTFKHYDFAAYLQPARQVGGDFYDVMRLDDDHIGMLIADVADKGFHAALFMAVVRTLFYEQSKLSLSPADVALSVHQGMFDVTTADDTFVTVFYAVLNQKNGRLSYVRAGHDRPLLVRRGQVTQLGGADRFLGMLPELSLTEHELQLEPGDKLVMYSDGIPDAVDLRDEPFGLEQLKQTVIHGHDEGADEMINRIASVLNEWTDGADPFDDCTLLVLEVKED